MNRLLAHLSAVAIAASLLTSALPLRAQMQGEAAQDPKTMPSPPATASVSVGGGTIDVKYNSPRMRGRKIMGALVPYGQVWRTGANPATTIITSVPLKFGNLLVPAGTHTLYTLPNQGGWQLIVNNQNGHWGNGYPPGPD